MQNARWKSVRNFENINNNKNDEWNIHGTIHFRAEIAINSKAYSQTADHAAPLHTWKATTTDEDGQQGFLVLWRIALPLSSAQAFLLWHFSSVLSLSYSALITLEILSLFTSTIITQYRYIDCSQVNQFRKIVTLQ